MRGVVWDLLVFRTIPARGKRRYRIGILLLFRSISENRPNGSRIPANQKELGLYRKLALVHCGRARPLRAERSPWELAEFEVHCSGKQNTRLGPMQWKNGFVRLISRGK